MGFSFCSCCNTAQSFQADIEKYGIKSILAWLSYFSSRNDANLCWEQGLLPIFIILCAALMGEAGRLQKWSNFTAVSLSLASSCCSYSNGFLQLSNVRSAEIMLCLGRNEKALHGRARYRQSAHTKNILQSKTKPPCFPGVFLEMKGGRTRCQVGGVKFQD